MLTVNFDDTNLSNEQCVKVYDAIKLYADALMPEEVVSQLVIDLEIIPNLDVQGQCVSEDDFEDPRWFTLSLKMGVEEEEFFSILAHEMVHVKQYAMNESYKCFAAVRRKIGIHTKWKGIIWTPKDGDDEDYDSPWEIEAYGREVGLYHRWMNHVSK